MLFFFSAIYCASELFGNSYMLYVELKDKSKKYLFNVKDEKLQFVSKDEIKEKKYSVFVIEKWGIESESGKEASNSGSTGNGNAGMDTESDVWGLDSKGLYCGANGSANHDNAPFRPNIPTDECLKGGLMTFTGLGMLFPSGIFPGFDAQTTVFNKSKDENSESTEKESIVNEMGSFLPGKYELSNLKNSKLNPLQFFKGKDSKKDEAAKKESDKKDETAKKESDKKDKNKEETQIDEEDEEFVEIKINDMYVSKGKNKNELILIESNEEEESKFKAKKISHNVYHFMQEDSCLGLLFEDKADVFYGSVGSCDGLMTEIHLEKI